MINIRLNSRIERLILIAIDEFLVIDLTSLLELSAHWLSALLALHYPPELIKSTICVGLERHIWRFLIIVKGLLFLKWWLQRQAISLHVSLIIPKRVHPADSKVDIWVERRLQKGLVVEII